MNNLCSYRKFAAKQRVLLSVVWMSLWMLLCIPLAWAAEANDGANDGVNDGAKETHKEAIPRIGVQLWSVKDDVKSNFQGTLQELSSMGFDGVELAGEFGPYAEDPEGLKAFLASLDLEISGAHVGFDKLSKERLDSTINFYKRLEVTTIIVPWDDRAWHPEKIKDTVAELNALAKILETQGMQVGYHNHAEEFRDYQQKTYWDYIASNTVSEVVLQQDVGWTRFAGKDPITYTERYPGRSLTTHYKIVVPKDEAISPIIGENSFDWNGLIHANMRVGGTQWIVVEQEEYPEGMTPMQSVAASKKGLDAIIAQLDSDQ